MSTSDVQEELNQLRKEVAALSAQRKKKASSAPREDEDAPADAEAGETEHAIKGQIEELIKLLQEEIRDMPAATTLAVFALGILMGRLLR